MHLTLGLLGIGDFLSEIVHLVLKALNGLIAALATVIQTLVDLLPNMPALPDPPDALITAESWVAWFFPVGTLINILAFVLSMWLVWQGIAIALRWAKGLGD